jgi:hypothetical protein
MVRDCSGVLDRTQSKSIEQARIPSGQPNQLFTANHAATGGNSDSIPQTLP